MAHTLLGAGCHERIFFTSAVNPFSHPSLLSHILLTSNKLLQGLLREIVSISPSFTLHVIGHHTEFSPSWEHCPWQPVSSTPHCFLNLQASPFPFLHDNDNCLCWKEITSWCCFSQSSPFFYCQTTWKNPLLSWNPFPLPVCYLCLKTGFCPH